MHIEGLSKSINNVDQAIFLINRFPVKLSTRLEDCGRCNSALRLGSVSPQQALPQMLLGCGEGLLTVRTVKADATCLREVPATDQACSPRLPPPPRFVWLSGRRGLQGS